MKVNLKWDIKFNEKLNSKFFSDKKLKPKSRYAMLKTIKHFLEFSKFPPSVNIKDVIFTGSLTNYNYNESSDVDLHIIIDYNDISDETEYIKYLFLKLKNIYADSFDITIHGYPIEIFIEDYRDRVDDTWKSSYSIVDDKWINGPQKSDVEIDKEVILTKAKKHISKIRSLINDSKIDELEKYLNSIKVDRSDSLQKEKSDYAENNLVFKLLRNSGVLEKITEFIKKHKSKELSIKEIKI